MARHSFQLLAPASLNVGSSRRQGAVLWALLCPMHQNPLSPSTALFHPFNSTPSTVLCKNLTLSTPSPPPTPPPPPRTPSLLACDAEIVGALVLGHLLRQASIEAHADANKGHLIRAPKCLRDQRPHLSGLVEKSSSFLFTTKMVFPKSVQSPGTQ